MLGKDVQSVSIDKLDYSFEGEDKMLTTSDASDYLKHSSPSINPFETSTPMSAHKTSQTLTGLKLQDRLKFNNDRNDGSKITQSGTLQFDKSSLVQLYPGKLSRPPSKSPSFSNVDQKKLQQITQLNFNYMHFDRKSPLKSPEKTPVLRDKPINHENTPGKWSPLKRVGKRKNTPPEHHTKKHKR